MTLRRWLPAALIVLAVSGGCTYYPTVRDVGGTLLRPQNGRAVRQGDHAIFYVEIANTGNAPDTLTAIQTSVAREAQLVAPSGGVVGQLEVPGRSVFTLHPGGAHIVLSGLVRPLHAGEVIIVTLVFEKTGNLGVVTLVE